MKGRASSRVMKKKKRGMQHATLDAIAKCIAAGLCLLLGVQNKVLS